MFRLDLAPPVSDSKNPVLTITSPKTGAQTTNKLFTVIGTAKDNVAVSEVLWRLNGGAWTDATTSNGWTNWTAPLNPLVPGTECLRCLCRG